MLIHQYFFFFIVTAGIRANAQFKSCTDATLKKETTRSFVRALEAVGRRDSDAAATVAAYDAAEK